MPKKIYEYTITADDPHYLRMVAEQVEADYESGYVDHANQWSRRYVGDNEDDDDQESEYCTACGATLLDDGPECEYCRVTPDTA